MTSPVDPPDPATPTKPTYVDAADPTMPTHVDNGPEPALTSLGAMLVGGASSRMGRDKAGLALDGVTLARRCADLLCEAVTEVVQVGGDPSPGLGIDHLPDLRPGIGPAGGIETALSHAAGRPLIVLAVDLPLVPAALLQKALKMVDAGALIAAPRRNGRWHPLCAAFGAGVLPRLVDRLDRGILDLHSLADELATPIDGRELEAFGNPEDVLLNINTPAELARAEALLAGAR